MCGCCSCSMSAGVFRALGVEPARGRVFETGRLMRSESMLTADLLRTYGERWKLMIVGDAAMHPSELTSARGNINPRMESNTTGMWYLKNARAV